MLNTIRCKYCGKEFEITEAFTHQIIEQAISAEREKAQKEKDQLRIKIESETEQKVRKDLETGLKMLQQSFEEEKIRARNLQAELMKLSRDLQKSRQEKEEMQYKMQKKLIEEQGKIKDEERKRLEEEHGLKDAEKDKKLQDALRVNEELRRKLEQGSQQIQGEVMELALEELLKKEFPADEFMEVKKGVRGADIIQKVIDKRGRECGVILWESKNAKWNEGWMKKLREDQREANANQAILVLANPPPEIKTSAYKGGVWITDRKYVIPLVLALRYDLIRVNYEKQANVGKNEKMEIIYRYLTGTEFKHRIEAIVEAFIILQDDIEREKRWFSQKWARQEKEIRKIVDNTYGMYGELQAVTGRELQSIQTLDLPSGSREG